MGLCSCVTLCARRQICQKFCISILCKNRMCCLLPVAALRRHRCCRLRRRCVVSVEFNLVSRKTNLVEEQRLLGVVTTTAELTTLPPPPTHTHMGFVQNSVEKTKTRRLKMAQFALCRQHKQNDINRQCEWKVYSGSRRFEGDSQ